MVQEPIDFVIPWVDGSDPAWRAEKARYAGELKDAPLAKWTDGEQRKTAKSWDERIWREDRLVDGKTIHCYGV